MRRRSRPRLIPAYKHSFLLLEGAGTSFLLPANKIEIVENKQGERVILRTRAGYLVIATRTGTTWKKTKQIQQ